MSEAYDLFISYKHGAGTGVSDRLDQALQRYALPFYSPARRIFRDEKYLKPAIDLPALIREALDGAEFLLLLASPEAARSPWVKAELEHWCSKPERLERLLIAWCEGTITTSDDLRVDWAATDALPTALRGHLDEVPFLVDLRGYASSDELSLRSPAFKKQVNSIVAALEGVSPAEMLGIEDRQHRRNMIASRVAVGAVTTLLTLSGVLAGASWQQRGELLAKTEELVQLDVKLSAQRDELNAREARVSALDKAIDQKQKVLQEVIIHLQGDPEFLKGLAKRAAASGDPAVFERSLLVISQPFGEGPMSEFDQYVPTVRAQERLNEYAATLLDLGFQGTIYVEGHAADWCMLRGENDDFLEPPPTLLAKDCDAGGHSTDYNLALSQRFADSVGSHLRRWWPSGGGIEVKTIAYGEERPAVPYPVNGTAAEWNAVANQNQRVELRREGSFLQGKE